MLLDIFQNIFIYGTILSICVFPFLIFVSRNKNKYKPNHIYKMIGFIAILLLIIPFLHINIPKFADNEKANIQEQSYIEQVDIENLTNTGQILKFDNTNLLKKNIDIKSNTIYEIIKYIPLIWLFIASLLLIYNLISYMIYIKSLKIKYYDNVSKEIVDKLNNDLKAKRNIITGISEKIDNPISIGIIRKRIIFPKKDYTVKEYEFMIKHEIYHIKNKDIEFKFILLILNCLYWFNPITYYITKLVDEIMELNVDSKVLNNESINIRSEYGKILLKQIEENRNPKIQTISCFANSRNSIKERFYNIMQTNKKSKSTVIISILITLLTLAFIVILIFPNINFSLAVSNIIQDDIQNASEEENYIVPILDEYKVSFRYSNEYKGVDLSAEEGTNIIASHSGIIVEKGVTERLGKYLIIESDDGIQMLYSSCSELYVNKGDNIESGVVIGKVGKTGMSTGNRLHIEMRLNNQSINPEKYINF